MLKVLGILSILILPSLCFGMGDELDDLEKEYEHKERKTVHKPISLVVETIALHEDGMEEFVNNCIKWDKYNWNQQRILMMFFHYTQLMSEFFDSPDVLRLVYIGYANLIKALEVQLGLCNDATLDECLDSAIHIRWLILKTMY
jgi:hypothetical protein